MLFNMKPIQGATYTVPGSSLHIYVVKIRYVSKEYTKAVIEFVRKGKSWSVFCKIKNAKLYHDQISHWQKINTHQ